MSSQSPTPSPPSLDRPGIADVAIVPLVAIAYAVRVLLRRLVRILINIVDWAFPILLQVMRFPLFTLRILGDALSALLKGMVRFLPIGGSRRQAWQAFVSRQWAWLRGTISYKAFEEWLHHAFEVGMAWVFQKCRTLTPSAALLVLLGAVLWLPISFAVATGLHAVLFAKALVWPAWTQLLHPVATVIAKSKLLVLPVYPASWPQARQHPIMQAMIRFYFYLASRHLVRKIGHRYRQIGHGAAMMAEAAQAATAASGLRRLMVALVAAINAAAAASRRGVQTITAGLVAGMSAVPGLGAAVRRYADHYADANRVPPPPLSERVRDFYDRWSIKFTVDYYEAKDRDGLNRIGS